VLATCLTAAGLAAALLTAPAATAAPAAADSGTNGAAVPQLAWGPCPVEDPAAPPDPAFDCATATVPLDYDDVDGETIELALQRRSADNKAARIGSLFINPGGPGGSGVDVVNVAGAIYAPAVLARFDMIGFDPRGVARSTPLTCFESEDAAIEFVAFQPAFPFTEEEEQDYITDQEAFANRCEKLGDPILSHMSTGNAARDLDLLRAAVGDEQLTYAGYSYGTQLGQTYANLFPGKVRALVIDGVVDPDGWTGDDDDEPFSTRLRSDEGSFAALQEFFRLCEEAGTERCALAADDPEKTYDQLALDLQDQPVEVPLGFGVFQRVGYADLVSITLGALYAPQAWTDLAALIANLVELRDVDAAGDAYARLLSVVPRQEPLPPADAEEPGPPQTIEGFPGVACLDSGDNPPLSAWPEAAREADERAPYFGRLWTWVSAPCGAWPATDDGRYAGPWTAQTAHPVLIIGTRYDPATRYENAEIVADLLPQSTLLTLEGWGHTAAGVSTCINDSVTAYLVAQVLPADGTVCTPDVEPFTSPPEPTAGLDERGFARARMFSLLPGATTS